MPLKPGQKKIIKVEMLKLKGLEELKNKINKLTKAMGGLTTAKDYYREISKDVKILEKKVQAEITATNEKIKSLKATATKSNPALDKLINEITKNCSQVIPYYRKAKLVLLRGIKTDVNAFMGRSWDKRDPKDSNEKLQMYYDIFLKKQGFKALRSNSIFTTSHAGQASNYGRLFIIFPKNGFAFHWNKHNSDLVLDAADDIFDTGVLEDIIGDVESWYEKKNGKNLNWKYYDPYEVAFDLEKFIETIKKLKYPKANQITLEKLLDVKGIKNDIGPTKDNFLGGLKSGNEMMISGEYYAINIDSKIAEYILTKLDIKANNID